MVQQLWWHGLLMLLACQPLLLCGAQRSLENEFVTLPPAFGIRAPKRLVFNQADLAGCLADLTATTCVLRAPIKIDAEAWKQRFASTYGTAVNPASRKNITITTSACFNCIGERAQTDNGGVVSIPRLEKLDWSGITGVIALRPGTRLRISNVDMSNFSLKSDYVYTPATPYQSVGSGVSIWPTINGAPNSTFVGLNITGSYYNPSTTDDCPRYVEKTLLYLYQSFGAGNISVVSPTAVMIIGPIRITVEVNNGSTGEYAGNATAVYKYVTVVCVERLDTSTAGGMSTGELAAAIAAPIAGVLLLGGGLLLWWLRRRNRSRLAGPLPQPLDLLKADGGIALVGVCGKVGPPPNASDVQGKRDTGNPPRVPPWSLPGAPTAVAAAGCAPLAQARGRSAASSAGTSPHDSAERGVPQSVMAALVPMQQGAAGAQLAISGWESAGTVQSSGCNTLGSGQVVAWSSVPSASTITGGFATEYVDPSTTTGLTGLSGSATRTAAGRRADPTSALLKERSDAAVVKDVKLGPLLGAGSFGRVYRGRWKATPVAVKIIEHYSSAEGVGSSRGNRVSAGREMLFATSISHPNLVTTFHISTLSAAQRKAAGQLTAGGSGGTADERDPRRLSNVSTSSNSSSGEAGQPEMLETWIVMEYCPKGSLEKVIKSGKLLRADGQPDMVSIYKILMDTASGLDYLHSIGVVHGDLKTANVLLKGGKDQKGISCKITDFGLSRVLDINASHISTGTHGTVVYMPKELLLSGRMTPATDIYSFGLMMWELFAGRRIMEADEGLSIGQMFYMIAYQNWRPELPLNCPPGYVELMTACWHENPDQRPSAQQLLRRLQILQGQARQELIAARKARTAADQDAESAGNESETSAAAQHLRELRMRAAGSTANTAEAAAATAAAPTARSSAAQPLQQAQQHSTSMQLHQGGGGAAGTSVPAWPVPDLNTPDASFAARQPGTVAGPTSGYRSPFADPGQHNAGAPARSSTDQQESVTRQGSFPRCLPGSSSLSEQQLQDMKETMAAYHHQQMLLEPQEAGTTPAAPPAGTYIPEQYMQTLGWVQQHTSAAAAVPGSGRSDGAPVFASNAVRDTQQSEWQTIIHPVDVGFVNPFGQEFVGCLPQFDQLTDPDGQGLQPYIAALEAAAARKAALGAGRGGRL